MRWQARAVTVLALVASGCAGNGSGETSGAVAETTVLATGSLPLDATSATAVFGGATCLVDGASVGVAYAVLDASDQAGFCGYLQQNQARALAGSIRVTVVRVDPTSATTTLTAGTYPIVPSPTLASSSAILVVSQNDAACVATEVTATSGFVIVASAAPFQGSIWATLSDGGKVTGPFDAGTCAATLPGDICTGAVGPSNPACAP